MRQSSSTPPRQVARVFFEYGTDGRLVSMRGLRLSNHLTNVKHLAMHWDFSRAFGEDEKDLEEDEDRRQWLVRAAERHDEGKPNRFKIRVEEKHGKKRFTYSFSGHRFDVEDSHPYIQQLIRLHHTFNVDDITEAQARLTFDRHHPDLAPMAGYFPLDLYALEMCDQIEAEVTTHVFGKPGDQQRAFMEFEVYAPEHTRLLDGPTRLQVFPYPFKCPDSGPDELRIIFESFVVHVPTNESLDGDHLKQLLLENQVASEERKEVVLCPLE